VAAGTFLKSGVSRTLALAAVLAVVVDASATAQEPVPPDTLETVPDSVRAEFERRPPREPQTFPERRYALRGPANEVFSCDRECVQNSTAPSLLELLIAEVPGITGIRAGYFSGPHHAYEGPYGPGFVRVYVDGTELAPLERSEADLRRVSLGDVALVRAYRSAAGLVIDVDTYRVRGGRAYSRISGGTGSPSLQILDGLFANGLASAFTVNGSFELLDAGAGGVENDRFAAFGRLSWMPWSNDFGVQVEMRREATDRHAADTADVRRNELLVRARGNIGDRAQLEAYAAWSDYRLEVPNLPEDEEPPTRDADAVGVHLTTGLGRGSATLHGRLSGGGAYAARGGDLSLSYPLGPASLEGGIELESWDEFSTRSWRAAASLADTLLLPLRLRAFAEGGSRGVGRPVADSADRVGFDALGVSGGFDIGPFRVSARWAKQRLDRPVGLDASFDYLAALDSARVELGSWEARLEGPILPVGVLIPGLAPIRVRGFWRQNDFGDVRPLYVPEHVARAELELHDAFFQGHLELWLTGFIERRGARLAPEAGSPDPVELEPDTWMGGHLLIKIADFRLFYRFANPRGSTVSDIPGAAFPSTVGLLGIRWEFFN